MLTPQNLTRRILPALLFATFLTGCATNPQKATPQVDRAAEAEQVLQLANRRGQEIGNYLSAAKKALSLATDPSASPEDRTRGMHVYNQAVTACVMALQQNAFFQDGKQSHTFQAGNATYQLQIVSSGQASLRDPAKFTRLFDSSKVYRKHLTSDIQRSGLGATLVGVTGDSKAPAPHQPPNGFAEPVTAITKFGPTTARGVTSVDLLFFDPQAKEQVTVQGTTFKLRGDFTAALAHFPRSNNLIFGIVAMLRSDRAVQRRGLYFCEPYNPKKIPIIFVHGLMSSPQAWTNFINELNQDPDFRRRYQAWVYFYPTGAPIAGTAMLLREDLSAVATRYPLKRNMILVGHSMGGILTRMQVTTTRDQLWKSVFGKNADAVYASFPSDSLLKRALIFDANPYIKRVVFFATPHRGSDLASLRIAMMAGSLIRLPSTLLKRFDSKLQAVVKLVDSSVHSVPNSIMGLSPKSELLQGISKLPLSTPHDCFIGNRGLNQQPLADSSDGVVPYWSAHLPGARSETIVPTGHDAFDSPESVAGLLRILKE